MWTCYIFCSYEWRHLLDHGLGRNKSGHTMIHWKQHVWLPMPGVAAHSWWHTGYHKNVRIFEVFAKCPTCRSESWGCWCSIEGCASLDPEHCLLINMTVLSWESQSACDYHLQTLESTFQWCFPGRDDQSEAAKLEELMSMQNLDRIERLQKLERPELSSPSVPWWIGPKSKRLENRLAGSLEEKEILEMHS